MSESTGMRVMTAQESIQKALAHPTMRANLAKSMGVAENDPVISRFERVTMLAVNSDPKLLNADRQSLYLACQAAANDKLMPDGKQGKLVVYSTKEGNAWVDKVQWQRMVGGLRVLAARHNFDLIAEVVHENDTFDEVKGSTPRIEHKPARLGTDRGPVIGFYCVATNWNTGRQYFDVMSVDDVDRIKVRTKSKKTDGTIVGPWSTDYNEMGKKTVAKRLFKSLPLFDDDIQNFINNDNDEYQQYPQQGATEAPAKADAEPSAPKAATARPSALQAVVDAESEDVIDVEATEVQAEPTPQPPQSTEPAAADPGDHF
jgi:recombination protein RecT